MDDINTALMLWANVSIQWEDHSRKRSSLYDFRWMLRLIW